MQLENTQATQDRLKEELTMRRTELDKIDTLEDKIKTELVQLAEKSDQLKKQMDTFANVGHDMILCEGSTRCAQGSEPGSEIIFSTGQCISQIMSSL